MTRPPVTTKFWIGDTVYRVHGTRSPGTVLEVIFQGDPAYPLVLYKVTFPKDCNVDDFYEIELTKTKREKTYAK
jgi:hypothetical protein